MRIRRDIAFSLRSEGFCLLNSYIRAGIPACRQVGKKIRSNTIFRFIQVELSEIYELYGLKKKLIIAFFGLTGKEIFPSAEYNKIMNAFVYCIKAQPVFTKTAAIRIGNFSQAAGSP